MNPRRDIYTGSNLHTKIWLHLVLWTKFNHQQVFGILLGRGMWRGRHTGAA